MMMTLYDLRPITAEEVLLAIPQLEGWQFCLDLHALKELLDQEEKKLNLLKSKCVRQTSPSE